MLKYEYHNLLASKHIRSNLPKEKVLEWIDQVKNAHREIMAEHNANLLGFYDLPDCSTKHIDDFIANLNPVFDTMLVLGIGGSALGNKALYSALKTEAELPRKLFVYDNVDPVFLYEILSQINLEKTLVNVITKSGTTAETMAGYMIVADIFKRKFPKDYQKRIIITTDKEKGFLRQVINQEGYTGFTVPDNVGGRFSVLSDVGLLSSAFTGIDIKALLKGAKDMREICWNPNIWENPAYLNGLIHFLYYRQGKNISVMMPYSNSLYDLADWYRQLWAESLGKRKDIKGREIYVGQTPVKALGTTDQHSQVQLYTEGPNDKVFTFLTVEYFKHDYTIPNLHPDREEVNYLGGKKLSELLNAERFATEIALSQAMRPNANIVFPQIDAYHLGQFIMLYEIQTVFTGKLLCINPLDQPGVEAGKIATYALMNKKGYDQERTEIEQYKKDRGLT
ncbi:glucose-6-phosphate isomerase [Candidatus Cloacimonas acidaminovorans]|uniref:Glucose-6-phosphate isomerase n=1 Tax=Cloacimonas acidaminovorans (strain Evry) TaxID=459349 RepID=B0VJD2_CLOAI|nr:glucose-6-phosphate isomerase [Candidatus Cloacimonas acidaminovorans]CAO81586.1 Glucose-6-phosphate isomerase (GPI) (Phosphoglucose isomerase) (PGI) (Phosphohexose isomerase) (PHI) [Candidatus Cloacimonas acidaminovorans str. Evry]